MKIIAKLLTISIILCISSLTLVGQKSYLFKDVLPLMAFVSDTKFDVELTEEYTSGSTLIYAEEKIRLEHWMMNAEQWRIAENETELSLEDWMVKPFRVSDVNLNELVKEESESPLKLEKWMYCCTDWKIVLL
ncbi:MAG TPA: hypothetical protein ENI20_10405 [Bacteroides sp.]|nr:hypothetical protein [Bacteroides sp.]